MDAETLRAAARIARGRAGRAKTDRSRLGDRRDGLERLGASRALDQLADDLEATASHIGADRSQEAESKTTTD